MTCVLQFDNHQGKYNAGDTVTGKVVCIFERLEEIKGLQLKLKGIEYSRRPKKDMFSVLGVDYVRVNCFHHQVLELMGPGIMDPGLYECPFSLDLPQNIPGSFITHLGGIVFSVEGALIKTRHQNNSMHLKQIIVYSPTKFEHFDNLQLDPTEYCKEKTMCWYRRAEKIIMWVNLKKEAYLRGDIVEVNVDIMNLSNVDIETVEAKLEKVTKVKVSYYGTKFESELMSSDTAPTGVVASGRGLFNFSLQIPFSTEFMNFKCCKFFSQKVKLEALFRRKHMPNGHIYRGKDRLVKEPNVEDLQKLRNQFEIEEQNMFYLRHAYLTPEQSHGHARALGKNEENFVKTKTKTRPFYDHVTIEGTLAHLRVKESWD